MALTPGTQIGPYLISTMLGAGGMGEVYRARDTRLQRDAALKVLPPGLLQDPERRARFEREARLLASLSHPNIAAIYGVEDVTGPDGVSPVLVLEFVEGQTLADRVAVGRVPVDETVAIARQIAEALEAAHERGVIHRDLKPANVQITRDGSIKVLDFGLAKALDVDTDSSISATAHSPTMTSGPTRLTRHNTAATQAGVVMGTAAYMSPEQARGRSVDRRTDVWAFGALLFELLTGTRAFPGETISDTIAAILTGSPDWTRLPRETPAALRALLLRCLDPDLRQRLQSIGEARIILSRPPTDTTVVEPAPGKRTPWALTLGLVAITAASAAALTWNLNRRPDNAASAGTRKVDLAVEGLLVGLDRPPVLSPDGTRIAYFNAGRLWIRSTADFTAREVPASDDARYPFWSPDSTELAFVQRTRLFRVRVDGGTPQFVGEVPQDMTGSGAGVWTPDDTFLLVGSDTSGITELSGRDGQAREVVGLDRSSESDFHEIAQLPDRRGFLVTAHTSQAAETIFAITNGKRSQVLKIAGENLRSPVYHPAGYLIFARETLRRGVWAVAFSLDSLTTTGEPFVLEASGRQPSVATDGTIMIVRPSERPSELVWIDRRGSRSSAGLLSGQVPEHVVWPTMRLSPDGQRVALGLEDDLWVYDLRRGSMSPISRGVQRVISPTWFPAGDRLLFAGFVGTRAWSVQEVLATQTNTPRRVLAESQEFQWPTAITPDGRWVIYGQSFSNSDLWIAPLDRPTEARQLMTTPANEREGYLSPDGRWLAYLSDESGTQEIYVRRFPIANDREMLSHGGASSIQWSGDGRELFYRGTSGVMSVRLQDREGRLHPSVPEMLFAPNDPALSRMFAAAADGQRFLFARATGSDHVGLILNWQPSDAR